MSLPARLLNTSRICKSTAINSLSRSTDSCTKVVRVHPPGSHQTSRWVFLVLAALAMWLGGCTSIRPIVKIGLIAPFEGLYRESGYAALEAMRQAIGECTPHGMDVLPVALDDSGDPDQARRAAQKLLVDPQVVAVVGPFLLDTITAVSTVMTKDTTIPWYLPILGASQPGEVALSDNEWLQAQVDFVAANTSATRILLLGLPAEWHFGAESNPLLGSIVPVVRVDDVAAASQEIQAGDALLWLGRPEAGAAWRNAQSAVHPENEFWMATQAGIDVFALHNTQNSQAHWLFWTPSEYNASSQPDGRAILPNDTLTAATYQTTCVALQNLAEPGRVDTGRWQLHSHPIHESGSP